MPFIDIAMTGPMKPTDSAVTSQPRSFRGARATRRPPAWPMVSNVLGSFTMRLLRQSPVHVIVVTEYACQSHGDVKTTSIWEATAWPAPVELVLGRALEQSKFPDITGSDGIRDRFKVG